MTTTTGAASTDQVFTGGSTKTSPFFSSYRRVAYGYREVAFVTLAFGLYLHVSRLIFGAEIVQLRLLVPRHSRKYVFPRVCSTVIDPALVVQLRRRRSALSSIRRCRMAAGLHRQGQIAPGPRARTEQ